MSAPVLVIDDFATMVRIMRGIVAQLGFTDIDACRSGAAALGKLQTKKYGFILCDQEMDLMTGVEFARCARAHPYNVRCPIIIATVSRESVSQCMRDGLHEVVDGFICKPFKAADLRAKLDEIDERRRAKGALLERVVPRACTTS